eukprot:m.481863 g.481863  ORF g.481863 m.481863 type:complete len:347 (+) comp22347_c0_seq1:286-1326(+)
MTEVTHCGQEVEPTPAAAGVKVAVTGASGFLASQVVAGLLGRGYTVHGTVRSLDPVKTEHLQALPGAADRLKLFVADLLKPGSFDEAFGGCTACMHTASPFFNRHTDDPEAELLKPAVQGTLTVLEACKTAGIKTVVLTSSTAAVQCAPTGPEHVISEASWSDEPWMLEKKLYYPLSKTQAERAAWKFVEENGKPFRLVAMNPTLINGPMLQPSLNTSSEVLLDFIKGKHDKIPSGSMTWVDVRDVALAHIKAFEDESTADRYCLITGDFPWAVTVAAIKSAVPAEQAAKLPTESASKSDEKPWRYNRATLLKFDGSKAKAAGMTLRSFEDTIRDTVLAEKFQALV